MSGLSKEFITERDNRIYQMRASGMSPLDIASRENVSPSTVHNAISRHIKRINGNSPLNFVEVIILELDRLDKMQSAIFPMTQHRRVRMDNGEEITVEPDYRAIDAVLKLMQARAKLLGLDVQRTMDISGTAGTSVPDVTSRLKGETLSAQEDEITSIEDESREMLKLAMEAGIIEESVYDALLADSVVEAEVVQEDV